MNKVSQTFLCLLLVFLFAARVQASDKVITVLTIYGFKAEDLVNIVKKYPELKDLDVSSEINQVISKKENQTIKLYSEKTNEAYIFTKNNGSVEVEKVDVQFEIAVKGLGSLIRRSLYESVLHETQSISVATQVSDAFKEEFSSKKGFRVQAFYDLQVEQYYENGKFIKYGRVLSATITIGSAMIKKIYQLDPENFSWALLPENAGNLKKPFYSPVNNVRVTSLFQLNRHHPVTRRHQPHKGIDFALPTGSPVFPAMEGEVVTISRTRSKGKFITILHDNGYETTYMHLKQVMPDIKVGMWVELDTEIGEVGRTGFSTGAHLHFGVIQEGFFVNPIYLLKGYSYAQKDLHENDEKLAAIDEGSITNGEVPEDEVEEL
jgi:murein DD-endopeptidase MepM/ murein hydrolase activator NlpD